MCVYTHMYTYIYTHTHTHTHTHIYIYIYTHIQSITAQWSSTDDKNYGDSDKGTTTMGQKTTIRGFFCGSLRI